MNMKRSCKRFFDIVLSSIGLIIAAPIMALIALAIKIDSPGEVIFAQERLGLKGKRFKLYKFRKFPNGWGTKGPGVTVAGDARMTRIGRFLERTKFDELPQLWNILKGDMSFVGPRPELVKYESLFKGEFKKVLDYVPGIFGPNQIAFRNESNMYPPDKDPEEFYKEVLFPQKAKNDIEYFKNSSCLKDLILIIKGVWVSIIGAVNWQRMMGFHLKVFLLDFFAIEFAWIGAKLLRYGLPTDATFFQHLWQGVWLYPLVVLPIIAFTSYKNPVSFFTFQDVLRLAIAEVVGWIFASFLYIGLINRHESIMVVAFGILLLLPFSIGPRIVRRLMWQKDVIKKKGGIKHKILIYGAGHRGLAIANLLQYSFPKVTVIGFLDDTGKLLGRHLDGKKVLGCQRDLPTIFSVHKFDQLWLAFNPEASKLKSLQAWCKKQNVILVNFFDLEPFAALE